MSSLLRHFEVFTVFSTKHTKIHLWNLEGICFKACSARSLYLQLWHFRTLFTSRANRTVRRGLTKVSTVNGTNEASKHISFTRLGALRCLLQQDHYDAGFPSAFWASECEMQGTTRMQGAKKLSKLQTQVLRKLQPQEKTKSTAIYCPCYLDLFGLKLKHCKSNSSEFQNIQSLQTAKSHWKNFSIQQKLWLPLQRQEKSLMELHKPGITSDIHGNPMGGLN